MMETIYSSETSATTRATWRHIPEDGILHSHRRENLKSYIALTGWALYRRRNVFPVRCKLSFYIPEDCILHSQRRKDLKYYIRQLPVYYDLFGRGSNIGKSAGTPRVETIFKFMERHIFWPNLATE
jgi:hypothetical protein